MHKDISPLAAPAKMPLSAGSGLQLKSSSAPFVSAVRRLASFAALRRIIVQPQSSRNIAPVRSRTSATEAVQEPGRSRHIKIQTADGCSLDALERSPANQVGRSIKAIVMVHGFAAEKRENGLFTELAKQLSKRYFVLMYDWRGLGKSEGVFANTTLQQHVDDLRDVIKWTAERHSLPTTAVCAVGFSLGCSLIALNLRRGLSLGAGVFLSPAVRPKLDMWPRYNTGWNRLNLAFRGYIQKANGIRLGPEILYSLRDTDLGPNAFDLNLPLLVCHGTDDVRIPINTSRECLAAAEHPDAVLLKEFPGASHSFRPTQVHRRPLVREIDSWLSTEATAPV